MTWIIVLFGGLVVGVGAFGALRPQALLRRIESAWKSSAGLNFAVGLRLVLGVVLLAAAPECRFPNAIRVLGAVSLVAAAGLALAGRERVEPLIAWWLKRSSTFIRGWCAVAIAFGAFLVAAAV